MTDPRIELVTKPRLEGMLPARLGDAALKAALVPFWSAGETVTAGAVRMTAIGLTIIRNTSGTTRPSYDATEAALWTAASGAGGAVAGTPLTIFVASATASAADKALATATYTCDGTDDQVQIQAAINAVKAAGGGQVLLSKGMFYLASPVQLTGSGSPTLGPHVTLRGAGMGSTTLRPLFSVSSALVLSGYVQCDVLDMAFNCYGSSSAIVSTAGAVGSWAFWRSTFKNLYIEGSSDGGSTGWAMNLESPFRSVFENIDVAGMVNGIRLYAATTGFFSGNCIFTRVFVLTYGSNGFAFKLDAVSGGILNALEFNLCEGFADGGTGNTAVSLGGAGQVNHTRWNATNFEQYDMIFRVVNGYGNFIDGTYWDVRSGAASNTTTLVQFDANASGNKVQSVSGHFTAIAHRLVVSTATDTSSPNIVENVALILDAGGAVTNSIGTAGAVITRAITAKGAGVAGASTVVVAPGAAAASTVLYPRIVSVPWTVNPTGVSAAGTSASYSGGTVLQGAVTSPGGATGNYFEWDVELDAGSYMLRVWYQKNASFGIITALVDGVSVGTVDSYAAAFASNFKAEFTTASLTAGRHTIRFRSDTKNASATSFFVSLHEFSLARTGA